MTYFKENSKERTNDKSPGEIARTREIASVHIATLHSWNTKGLLMHRCHGNSRESMFNGAQPREQTDDVCVQLHGHMRHIRLLCLALLQCVSFCPSMGCCSLPPALSSHQQGLWA